MKVALGIFPSGNDSRFWIQEGRNIGFSDVFGMLLEANRLLLTPGQPLEVCQISKSAERQRANISIFVAEVDLVPPVAGWRADLSGDAGTRGFRQAVAVPVLRNRLASNLLQ